MNGQRTLGGAVIARLVIAVITGLTPDSRLIHQKMPFAMLAIKAIQSNAHSTSTPKT